MNNILQQCASRSHGRVSRRRFVSAAAAAGALGLFATPAAAQVRVMDTQLPFKQTVCIDNNGFLVGLIPQDDCTSNDPATPLSGVTVGPAGSETILSAADGSATFNGGSTFNGGAQFNGQVSLTGFTSINQVNSNSINNAGALTTGSLTNQGSLQQNGNARFNGTVTMDGFYANSGTIGSLNTSLATASNLTITAGGRLNLSGNRIENVGAPVAGTDAANKDYVDTAVNGVQGNITALNDTVTDHETRITAVENTNNVQDTRLGAVETENVTQNTRLTSVENVTVAQDSRMTAIEAVNTVQSNQISTLQDQVGGLQTSVTGLRRNIQEANGGIAAAVALSGTMVVPDSNVSLSFNLATYRGQQGFSGAIVGRVAPKIYVNAGVGGSTVRKSTAGRVGISFGL